MVVDQVVECGNMFRGEHGASVEGADEEICRVGGTGIGLDIPQRSSVAVSKERRVGEFRERAVEVMYPGGSLFRWMYVCVDVR